MEGDEKTLVAIALTAIITIPVTNACTRLKVYDESAAFLRVECPHLVIDPKPTE